MFNFMLINKRTVYPFGLPPGIPTGCKSPLDGLHTGQEPNQNFMYQWVFKTVGIMGTKEHNPHQTSIHADQIMCPYSLSYVPDKYGKYDNRKCNISS